MIDLNPQNRFILGYTAFLGLMSGLMASITQNIPVPWLALTGRNLKVGSAAGIGELAVSIGVVLIFLAMVAMPLRAGVRHARETGQYIRYLMVGLASMVLFVVATYQGLFLDAMMLRVFPLMGFAVPVGLAILLYIVFEKSPLWDTETASRLQDYLNHVPLLAVFGMTFTAGLMGGSAFELHDRLTVQERTAQPDISVSQLRCYASTSESQSAITVFLENAGKVAIDFSEVDIIVFDERTGNRVIGMAEHDLKLDRDGRMTDDRVDLHPAAENTTYQGDAHLPGDLAGYEIRFDEAFEPGVSYDIEFRFEGPSYSVKGNCEAEKRP